jgi:hypothetical protein
MGRFITPDPSSGSGRAVDPASWNKYAYTRGDPVNRIDREGTFDDNPDCVGDICYLIDTPGYDSTSAFNTNCFAAVAFQPTDPIFQQCYDAYYGDPAPPPPPQQEPTCSITLDERAVARTGGLFVHTYLVVTEFSASGAITEEEVLEGGAQHPHNPLTHPSAPWGNLVSTPENVLTGGPYLGSTNPSSDTQLGNETGGTDVCDLISKLLTSIADYTATPGVPYALWPTGSSRNSNSFTFTLLTDIGLISDFQNAPSWAPGWGMLVPGLN